MTLKPPIITYTVSITAILLGCSGGDPGTPTVNNIADSTTTTPFEASPTVSLPSLASVNFSAAPSILGTQVTLKYHISNPVNALASDEAGSLNAEFADPKTLDISTKLKPENDEVVLNFLPSSARPPLTNSQALTLYFVENARSDDDGDTGLSPLTTEYDTTTGSLTAKIPASAFHSKDGRTYIARLKVGIAETVSVQDATVASSRVRATLAGNAAPFSTLSQRQKLQLRCPFSSLNDAQGDCIERSQYNPKRLVKTYNEIKPHNGVDLTAKEGTAIYAPAQGGKVIRGASQALHDCQNGTTECKDITVVNCGEDAIQEVPVDEKETGCGAGIYLVIDITGSPGYRIKYSHLNKIAENLIDPKFPKSNQTSGLLAGQSIIDVSKPIAWSGKTGIASVGNNGKGSPHLHMELYGYFDTYSCEKNGKTTTKCKVVVSRTDPFPFMIAEQKFTATPSNNTNQQGTLVSLTVQAKDPAGSIIRSSVENATERTPGGDPTRKICLTSSQTALKTNPGGTMLFSGPNNSTCTPWGTPISVYIASTLNPDTATTVAQYTTRADLPLKEDPLSIDKATVTFSATDFAFETKEINSPPTCVTRDASSIWYWLTGTETRCSAYKSTYFRCVGLSCSTRFKFNRDDVEQHYTMTMFYVGRGPVGPTTCQNGSFSSRPFPTPQYQTDPSRWLNFTPGRWEGAAASVQGNYSANVSIQEKAGTNSQTQPYCSLTASSYTAHIRVYDLQNNSYIELPSTVQVP